MPSGLGRGNTVGIRSEFQELPASVVASGNTSNGNVGASSMATAIRLIKLSQMAKVFYLDNSTNQALSFAVITPEDTTRTKVKWITLQSGKILNFELASNNLLLEAGLEVWVWAPTTLPSQGTVSMFAMG